MRKNKDVTKLLKDFQASLHEQVQILNCLIEHHTALTDDPKDSSVSKSPKTKNTHNHEDIIFSLDRLRQTDNVLSDINEQFALLYQPNQHGHSPLQIAIENDLCKVCWFMMLIDRNHNQAKGMLMRADNDQPIVLTALDCHKRSNSMVHTIIEFLRHSPEVLHLYHEQFGTTLLHDLLTHHHIDIIMDLLDSRQINLNLTDKQGNTLAHLAAGENLDDLLIKLIDHQIDFSIKNKANQLARDLYTGNHQHIVTHLNAHVDFEALTQDVIHLTDDKPCHIQKGKKDILGSRKSAQNECFRLIYWHLLRAGKPYDQNIDGLTFTNIWMQVNTKATKKEALSVYNIAYSGKNQAWNIAKRVGFSNFIQDCQLLCDLSHIGNIRIRDEQAWEQCQAVLSTHRSWITHDSNKADYSIADKKRENDGQFPVSAMSWLIGGFYFKHDHHTSAICFLGTRHGKVDFNSAIQAMIIAMVCFKPPLILKHKSSRAPIKLAEIPNEYLHTLKRITKIQYRHCQRVAVQHPDKRLISKTAEIIEATLKSLDTQDQKTYLDIHASYGMIAPFIATEESHPHHVSIAEILNNKITHHDNAVHYIARGLIDTYMMLIAESQNDKAQMILNQWINTLFDAPLHRKMLTSISIDYIGYLKKYHILDEDIIEIMESHIIDFSNKIDKKAA